MLKMQFQAAIYVTYTQLSEDDDHGGELRAEVMCLNKSEKAICSLQGGWKLWMNSRNNENAYWRKIQEYFIAD
jgi:hypothetical protein